jgi:hypothetical protein
MVGFERDIEFSGMAKVSSERDAVQSFWMRSVSYIRDIYFFHLRKYFFNLMRRFQQSVPYSFYSKILVLLKKLINLIS